MLKEDYNGLYTHFMQVFLLVVRSSCLKKFIIANLFSVDGCPDVEFPRLRTGLFSDSNFHLLSIGMVRLLLDCFVFINNPKDKLLYLNFYLFIYDISTILSTIEFFSLVENDADKVKIILTLRF